MCDPSCELSNFVARLVRYLAFGAAAVAFFLGGLWAAPPSADDLTDLFLPPVFGRAKLSPQGDNLAMLVRHGDDYAVGIYTLKTGKLDLVQRKNVIPLDFWWKGPRRLLIRTTDSTYRARDGSAIDVDGKNLENVWQLADVRGLIIDGLPDDPRDVLVKNSNEIERFDLHSDTSKRVDGGDLGFVGQWILDPAKRARATFTWHHDGTALFQWNTRAGGPWQEKNLPATTKRFHPFGVADDPQYLLGWDNEHAGEVAISRFDTSTGKQAVILDEPGFDPAFVLRLGRSERCFAAAYVEGAGVKLRALAKKDEAAVQTLQQRFTGFIPLILDRLPGDEEWLVWAGNSRVPGSYVLFDSRTGEIRPIARTHEESLREERFVAPDYFSFKAREGEKLSALIWRPAGIVQPPLVVMCPQSLPSQPAMDLYSPNIQALVALGFAVVRVNVRGSYGFGEALRAAATGDDVATIASDLEDTVNVLANSKIIDGKRVALLGWHLGGAIAWQVAAHSARFAAVASVNAPARVTRYDLLALSEDNAISELTTRLGGWFEAGRIADELSPIDAAPKIRVPALYMCDEDSLGGTKEDGGRIRRAAAKTGAPVHVEVAYSWSKYPKPPTKLAHEEAAIVVKIAEFFRNAPPVGGSGL